MRIVCSLSLMLWASAVTVACSTNGAADVENADESGDQTGIVETDTCQEEAGDAENSAQCCFNGGGGDNGWGCSVLTFELSEPVATESLGVSVRTSLGDTLEEFSDEYVDGDLWLAANDPDRRDQPGPPAELVETIFVQVYGVGGRDVLSGEWYEPEWVELDLRVNEELVASERFEDLIYECSELRGDDWCWAARAFDVELDL